MAAIHISEELKEKLSRYQFEIRHIIVIFSILIAFQIILIFFQKATLSNFLQDTQSWFQKYYAKRLAFVTTTNIELLFENQQRLRARQDTSDAYIVNSLNVILNQQLIHRSVDDIYLILVKEQKTYVIDNGQKLLAYFNGTLPASMGEGHP